jgi:penicillin amidase
MRFVRKALLVLGIVILALAVIVAGVGTWLVRRPWPQTKGNLQVAGLNAPVQVIRDKVGVPQIYAQNEHDLFFAQGYVHAQDRLWQMEFNRRISAGTLSAVLGSGTLDIDQFMRTLGLRRAAEQEEAILDDDLRAILQAYADGVNAYVDTHRGRLPLEFTILGVDPAPWTPVDTLAWGKVMAYNLCSNMGYELLRGKIIAQLDAAAAQQLMPPYADGAPVIIPPEARSYTWLRDASIQLPDGLTEILSSASPGAGSNNWVVHGSRTATGKPLLANDMHLGLDLPSIWYEVGLHGGRLNVTGFSFVGVPLVIVGHNSRIAWGVTNLPSDVQDLYIEKVNNAANPTQYEYQGQWLDLQVVPETIEVEGESAQTLNVLITRHGPIINGVMGSLQDAEPMALQWTALQARRIWRAVALLDMASNWDEFRQALSYWDVPSQNFVYGDVDGNIGYQSTGLIPIRAEGHDGTLPVPGWTGEYEWQGFIPFDELPSVYNPPTGFVVSANNKVVPDSYPYHLATEWSAPYRAQRITELLAADDHITIQDIKDIQSQTYSLPAEALRPYLLAVQPATDLETRALQQVRDWDLYLESDRVGAAVYEVWNWFLVNNTLRDELGEDLLQTYLLHDELHMPMMIALMAQPDSSWFDDHSTPAVETRDDILRRSLSDAVAWLSSHHGSDPAQWKWGRLHYKVFVHNPLGQSGIGVLEDLFNSKAIPARGDSFTVNAAWLSLEDEPFRMTGGASERYIADLSDLGNSLTVITTGQSGQLFHPHRTDQILPWQNIQYHPMVFDRGVAEASAEGMLTLSP